MVSDENEPSCGGRKRKEKKEKMPDNEGQEKKVERRVSKAHLQPGTAALFMPTFTPVTGTPGTKGMKQSCPSLFFPFISY